MGLIDTAAEIAEAEITNIGLNVKEALDQLGYELSG